MFILYLWQKKKIITLAFTFTNHLSSHWSINIGGKYEKRTQDTFRKCETPQKKKKTCMNQTEHCFDYPLTGSLSWWLCLTTKQTVIHMSLLWPHFHLEQFHRGHWKQRSWRVRDLNPSPASVQQPLPQGVKTTPCVILHLRQALFMLAAHLCVFFVCFPGVRGEWQWRIPINVAVTFPPSWSKFSLTVSQWDVRAFSVNCKKKNNNKIK